MPEGYPDARFMIALSVDPDDLDRGLDKLNPILKEILLGRIQPTRGDAISSADMNLGRSRKDVSPLLYM